MLTLSSKPKLWGFHVAVLWSTAEKCTEIRVVRAANLASWRPCSRSRRLYQTP